MINKKQIIEHIAESCAKRNIKPGINEAIYIASYALMDVIDKSGEDYSLHWLKVALDSTRSSIKIQIGILHDVIEDTDWTLDDLRQLGFDERVISGVHAMTRDEQNDESYFSFIERCSKDPYAIDVKLNDLRHNLDQSRNTAIVSERDLERIKKYNVSYQYLLAIKSKRIQHGTTVENFAAEFFARDKNYQGLTSVFNREGRTLLPPIETKVTRKIRGKPQP
jgi:(p)ppGpp synthase/HD superfamily hydrolase